MKEQAESSIRKALLSHTRANRRHLISVAIFIPSVLILGIYAGVQMNRHFVVEERVRWSCDHYWDGILAGGGKWCEAPLGHGVSLRFNTGWPTPDIGTLARIVPAQDTHHSLTHVALIKDHILVKASDGSYYILSFEDPLTYADASLESSYGPMDEDEFFVRMPNADIEWLDIPKP